MDGKYDKLKFFGLKTPPPFAYEKLLPWDSLLFSEAKQYAIEEERCGCASLNVFKVTGTKHPSYAGNSWMDLLEGGQRMTPNLSLFSTNPGYYEQIGAKMPYMQYISIDGGDLYIGDEGNHRTCIARFHFFTQGHTTIHGITHLNYRIDWAFKSLCETFKQTVVELRLPIHLTVVRSCLERTDATDWKLDKYSLAARVVDARKNEIYLFDFNELQKYLELMKKPWWKLWQVRF